MKNKKHVKLNFKIHLVIKKNMQSQKYELLLCLQIKADVYA